MLHHALKEADNVFLIYKTHLAVNLSELRLAVGAQVFIAEALDNLEIAVHAGHHQQLFEELRALGQGIELSGIHARGYHKVTGTFRRGINEYGSLNLQESFFVQELTSFKAYLVA